MALKRIADSRNRQCGKDDVIQEFGTVYPVPIGTTALNQLLADTALLSGKFFDDCEREPELAVARFVADASRSGSALGTPPGA
jgi:hypothetical protein